MNNRQQIHIDLKAERQNLGFTPREMSALMGIMPQAYSRLETGARRLTKGHLNLLHAILFISQRDLLTAFVECQATGPELLQKETRQ